VLSAIMGVGGGFILVPAMIYLLRMPASMVVGTSLFQIVITTALTTVLQAGRNQTVDVVLAGLLLGGGVVGAQFGARASVRFRAEELRAVLGIVVLLVGLNMGTGPAGHAGGPLRVRAGSGGAVITPDIAPTANAPAVSAALTDATVKVTSSFNGARIVLYGAVYDPLRQPHDVVVVVRGPQQPVRISRKVRVAGLWLNSRPVTFEGAPGYYMAASTRPLNQVTGFANRRRLGLGVGNLAFAAPAETRVETRYGVSDVVVSRLGGDYLDYRRAVIRLKQDAGLYAADSDAVRFVDRGLFRADIQLPSSAPSGRYVADILLFRGGQPIARRSRALTVEKVGVERTLYTLAHERPWSYGILSVVFGLLAGWGASVVFRRN
jgi:uncharacterized protein (TIGR02186 family)